MGKIRRTSLDFAGRLVCATVLLLAFTPEPTLAAGVCATGSWTSGNLEIHHINIGQADSTLIVGPTGKSLLFDVGETHWNSSSKAQIIGPYVEGVLGCKALDYVLISHFHLDHIGYVGYGGLWNLVETQGFSVGTTFVRNYANYLGSTSGTFTNWKTYLEGAGQTKLNPMTAMEGTSQVDLGAGVTFNIVTIDGNGALIAGNFSGDSHPPSENDYSIGAILSYGNFDEWLGGDLDGQYEVNGFGYTYHDIELSVAPEVDDVDVYKANHHGSSHSSSTTFINQLDPEVSVLSLGDGNNYGHPPQSTIDRLLATSTVYMTQRGDTDTNIGSAIVAGNILIKTTDGSSYTVNGTMFTATEPIRTDIDGDGYFAEADPNDNNISLIPAPNGGCGAIYQTCVNSCQVTAGQVVINEVLPSPSPSTEPEWLELYNTTGSTINIGYCYIDDIVGGSPAYQIPASSLIPPHGFWTLDRITYFNNTGDDVRFLKEDASTVLDALTYGNTNLNLSRYRFPDGGSWAGSPTSLITIGQTNTLHFYPIVSSIVLADENPTDLSSVNFTVTFSKAVTGVNSSDFTVTNAGMTGAAISAVKGSGTTYTVTVNPGTGTGTIRLDVVDDDSIRDGSNQPPGSAGIGNGNFSSGETYTINRSPNIDVFIDTELKGQYFLSHGESTRQSFADIDSGPVQIASTNSANLISALRVIWQEPGQRFSYSEMMGLPKEQLSNEYWFPWYNNLATNSMDQGFRIANVDNTSHTIKVYIGASQIGTDINLPGGGSTRVGYGVDNGPIRITCITCTNPDDKIIAALRVIWKEPGFRASYSEMMGLPKEQVSNEYWFPWYNNAVVNSMDQGFRIANVDTSAGNSVEIWVGSTLLDTIHLGAGGSTRVGYNVDNGPIRIVCTTCTNIDSDKVIAALRVIWKEPGFRASYSEMMGLPTEQLSTEYWFPWYNNLATASMDQGFRIANLDSTSHIIRVFVGATQVGTDINLIGGDSTRVNYPVDNGPIRVICTTCNTLNADDKIIAALRVIWQEPGFRASYSEMMGLPKEGLSTEYWFPWYNNLNITSMDQGFRFGVP